MEEETPFIESTLGSDEKILATAQAHGFRFFVPSIYVFLCLVFTGTGAFLKSADMIVIGVLMTIAALLFLSGRMKIEIACTDRRVIYKRGLLWYRFQELRLNQVETAYVFQPPAPGLMGFGTVCFTGTGGILLEFKYVKDPFRFKTAVEDVMAGET